MIENVTIGSDVEFFVEDKKGEIVSAEGLINGTKEKPFRFDATERMFATQLDNVLAEGNIPPAKTREEFHSYIKHLRAFFDSTIPQQYHTAALASARLSPKYLQTVTAQRFGCDPALNAWSLETSLPRNVYGSTLRSAGFHIHVGYKDPNEETNIRLARAMDLYLGVPSVIVEPKSERRLLGYGMSGNMRHQPHGVEYRTLSSYFASRETLVKWAFDAAMASVNAVNNGLDLTQKDGLRISRAINFEDKKLAGVLVRAYGIQVPV